MEPIAAARPWQRVCVIALGGVLLTACVVAVLLPLSGSLSVGTLTSSGASAGSQQVTFTCGSDLFGKDYTEAAATAILGPGRFFLSDADVLNRACARTRFRRSARVVFLFASGVLLLALGLLWPRRRTVRWTALALALILGLAAVVVPIDGTLGW